MPEKFESPFDLVRTSIGGLPAVLVYGELDILTAPRLHEALTQLIEEDPPAMLVDMANVTFIDSTGLGTLVAAHRRLDEKAAELRLVAIPEGVRKALEITGLSQRFQIYPDSNAAASGDTMVRRGASDLDVAGSGTWV